MSKSLGLGQDTVSMLNTQHSNLMSSSVYILGKIAVAAKFSSFRIFCGTELYYTFGMFSICIMDCKWKSSTPNLASISPSFIDRDGPIILE